VIGTREQQIELAKTLVDLRQGHRSSADSIGKLNQRVFKAQVLWGGVGTLVWGFGDLLVPGAHQ
ncbi:MAG: hypothetical protein AAFY77_10000, partial [Pseudomonadota bacterium]